MNKARIWIGRILSTLVALALLLDAFGKFAKPIQVSDSFTHLGLPISRANLIGTLLVLCTILYILPMTKILGAVLLTGYFGGAIAIHVRAGSSVFEMVFPCIFGVIVWAALALRDARVLPFMVGATD